MKENIGRKKRIVIVDDDEDILDLLQYNFTREGYFVRCLRESSKALDSIKDFHPDLIILDLMMGPYNGIEVCRMIREHQPLHDKYIFFLTAKSDKYYQRAIYDVGADEFIEKIAGLSAAERCHTSKFSKRNAMRGTASQALSSSLSALCYYSLASPDSSLERKS